MFNDPLRYIDLAVSASAVIPPVKAQTLFHHVLSIALHMYVCMHTVTVVTLVMCHMSFISQSDS